MALSCMPCQVFEGFFFCSGTDVTGALPDKTQREVDGSGDCLFPLPFPANVFPAQHQHGFGQATVLSYSMFLKHNPACALSCLLLLQRNAYRPIRYKQSAQQRVIR